MGSRAAPGPVVKVLIVDDERYLARMMQTILEDEGYEVALAHSLADAQQAVGPFDLVIADVRLPNGDGRHLRETFPTTPFLSMSGFPDMLPDLPKPFTPAVFRQAVRQAVKL